MTAFDEHALACLRRGLAQARAGDYFAAHDDWEEVWQGLSGHRRMFWQAMIQLVVGGYHFSNGNLRGCQGQWQKALVKCDSLLQQCAAPSPEPVVQLREILQAELRRVAQGENPLPALDHFAVSVLSETWFAADFA